jgi:hypothetical protein
MNFSKHAEKRCNQRGIRPEIVNLILRYGEYCSESHGCAIYMVSDKSRKEAIRVLKNHITALKCKKPEGWSENLMQCKKVIQRFDKLLGKMVIVDEEGRFEIITAYQAKSGKIKTICQNRRRNGYYR